MSFEKLGDVVFDTATGLTWDGWVRDGDPKSSVDAVNAAAIGGHTDWRLPTPVELLTLVDSSRMNPACDADIFPDAGSKSFRTSTLSQNDPGRLLWAIDFIDGRLVHLAINGPLSTRLVCGTWAIPALTIVDENRVQQGRVMWSRQAEPDVMTVHAAMQLAAQQGKRLPTRLESVMRMDYAHVNPAINTDLFHGDLTDTTWTSTPMMDAGHNGMFASVDMASGMSTPTIAAFNIPVWFVQDVGDAPVPIPPVPPTPPAPPMPPTPPAPPVNDLSPLVEQARQLYLALLAHQ